MNIILIKYNFYLSFQFVSFLAYVEFNARQKLARSLTENASDDGEIVDFILVIVEKRWLHLPKQVFYHRLSTICLIPIRSQLAYVSTFFCKLDLNHLLSLCCKIVFLCFSSVAQFCSFGLISSEPSWFLV